MDGTATEAFRQRVPGSGRSPGLRISRWGTNGPTTRTNLKRAHRNANQHNTQGQLRVCLTDGPKPADIGRVATADLRIEKLTVGTGAPAQRGRQVTVHYTGTFQDGRKFDSSLDRAEPFSFLLGAGQVIAGWDQGVATMVVGDKVRMTIPPELAYGRNGYPGAIPPNATLIFEVELIEVG